MICPECTSDGKTSKSYPYKRPFSTAMASLPYYDETGRYHNHDMIVPITELNCSNGHAWSCNEQSSCLVEDCDYGR